MARTLGGGMATRAWALGVAAWLAACGNELARVPHAGSAPVKVTVDPSRPVAFWADVEVTMAGTALVSWAVTVKDGGRVHELACDPMDVRTPRTFIQRNGVNDRLLHYLGRMRCEVTVSSPEIEVGGTFNVAHRPAVFDVHRMDLVVMQ